MWFLRKDFLFMVAGGLFAQPVLQALGYLGAFYDKPIMTIGRVDLDQGGIGQVLLHVVLLFDRTKYIATDADQEGVLRDALQNCFCIATTATSELVGIHGFGECPVAKGVESLYELITLVIDIGSSAIVVKFFGIGVCLVFYHDTVVAVGEHAYRASGFESFATGAGRIIGPCTICLNGQALGGMHSDAPGAFGGGGGQQEEALDNVFLCYTPLKGLVSPHTTAHQQINAIDAEVLAQQDVRLNHIADGDVGESVVIGLLRFRIDAEWPRSAITGAEYIGADNKILVRVDGGVWSHNSLPPIGYIRIGGEGMADPNHLAVCLQASVGVVGHCECR